MSVHEKHIDIAQITETHFTPRSKFVISGNTDITQSGMTINKCNIIL